MRTRRVMHKISSQPLPSHSRSSSLTFHPPVSQLPSPLPMPLFKNSNASQTLTSSSAPLQPKVESVFDSSSFKSPLFSPNYQVVGILTHLVGGLPVLTRRRRSPSTLSPTRSRSSAALDPDQHMSKLRTYARLLSPSRPRTQRTARSPPRLSACAVWADTTVRAFASFSMSPLKYFDATGLLHVPRPQGAHSQQSPLNDLWPAVQSTARCALVESRQLYVQDRKSVV